MDPNLIPTSFGDLLKQISKNVQAIDGLQMEATHDDTVDSLVNRYDRTLPFPGIEQSRAILAECASEVVRRRDEFYRSEGAGE